MRNQLRASFAKIFLAVTISLCAIPIVGVATISLLAGLMIASLPRAAFAQTDMGAGYCSLHGNYTGASCPSCSSGDSGNSGGDYNGPNLWNILRGLGNNSGNESQVSPAEQARRQRIAESYTANQQGVEFYKKGNWARALALFQEAVNKDPADPICRRNLANAKNALQSQQASQQRLNQAYNANERGIAFAKKRDWANAVRYYEDAARKNPNDKVIRSNLVSAQDALQTQRAEAEKERLAKQQDKAAAKNIQQIVQDFSQTITPAPSPGGAGSDGRNSGNPPGGGGLDFISPIQTASAAKPAAALEFSDPMVVNAQNVPSGVPKDLIRDAVADKPKGSAAVVPMGANELGSLEKDLRKRLAEATDPDKAWLLAQLGWVLQQKGDTAAAVKAIKEASDLDPNSSLLKLLNTAAIANTKEKLADAVVAAQEYLKSHPGNRVAAGILADADVKLRKATGAAAPDSIQTVPLVPFAQQNQLPPKILEGSDEAAKVKAEKDFVFQDFGKQSHQPHWQYPPAMDKRINLDKHPELKQNLIKREALVAEVKAADPNKAEEIKKQVESLDKETEKKAQEILKMDFPSAAPL